MKEEAAADWLRIHLRMPADEITMALAEAREEGVWYSKGKSVRIEFHEGVYVVFG